MGDFSKELIVLQRRWPALADRTHALIVVHRMALARGHSRPFVGHEGSYAMPTDRVHVLRLSPTELRLGYFRESRERLAPRTCSQRCVGGPSGSEPGRASRA